MADRFKNLAKNGWHPEKSKTSSSGAASDSKFGQVKGWVGKAQGKDTHAEAAREHQSAPLSTLKDPASFAPPPKRIPGASPVSGGLGAAPPDSARQRLQGKEEAQRRAEQESVPQGPYRTDTTGLSTAHLPKPPAFRPNAATPPPVPASRANPPSLPPRLPPRQTENVDEYTPPAPPSYGEAIQQPAAHTLNQGAMNRLGQAGVAVPGLGIGRNASPPVPPRQRTLAPPPQAHQASNSSTAAPISPPATASNAPQLNELHNRLAKMNISSTAETAPSAGTSWADKQAALRTASNIRNDSSKVSSSDLKSAASTANNFKQRHGEQTASGWRAASGLNQKYGIAGKVNSFAVGSNTLASSQAPVTGGIGKKPPPPPAKKPALTSTNSGEPPPIPLSSKPKF
ncbi:hypothetical protein BU25DRAFT_462833 [Macroventuria anomochaeta]|uniref:Uncharacterized protein n=1 Tax=Macroventuria anomochaeta TaxID=301207 RepID=A0ACB6RMF7_9PLEO|nr:uncharacterized protein BU25DRAFT_462833 [Macroventuria anomochaeta]KAF2622512.1 hypothetical protein BU25DRAFT_462833 [Macroventuria anomochaeta]